SSSMSTAAPASAMVAGSRWSGAENTNAASTAASTATERRSSTQSVTMPGAFMPMTSTRRSLLPFSERPQIQWTSVACTAITTSAAWHDIDQEGIEIEARLGADQDVGRIADQGRGAADIRGEHFSEQERKGRQFQLLGVHQRHRHNEKNRADIV